MTTTSDRAQLVRDLLVAFAHADRERAEELLAEDLRFSAPPDPELDRDGFFARCWPGAGDGTRPDVERLLVVGDEVVVTYERTSADGSSGRNTEILTFRGDRIARIEVYFGWTIPGT